MGTRALLRKVDPSGPRDRVLRSVCGIDFMLGVISSALPQVMLVACHRTFLCVNMALYGMTTVLPCLLLLSPVFLGPDQNTGGRLKLVAWSFLARGSQMRDIAMFHIDLRIPDGS